MSKKLFAVGLIVGLALIVLLLLSYPMTLSPSQTPTERNYLEAKLYGITQDNLLLVEDECGNLWELEGLDLREGDKLLIVTDNNNTINNKHDDVVIGVYVMARPTEAQE
jgi:hypothetical protein